MGVWRRRGRGPVESRAPLPPGESSGAPYLSFVASAPRGYRRLAVFWILQHHIHQNRTWSKHDCFVTLSYQTRRHEGPFAFDAVHFKVRDSWRGWSFSVCALRRCPSLEFFFFSMASEVHYNIFTSTTLGTAWSADCKVSSAASAVVRVCTRRTRTHTHNLTLPRQD